MKSISDNHVIIITPCFNENITVITFLQELRKVLIDLPFEFTVIVVDDASTDGTVDLLNSFNFSCNNVQVKVITLLYNLGHQGAIYQGFLYARQLSFRKCIIIDADGEDNPMAIKELVFMKQEIVHVVRGKRCENLTFRLLHKVYQQLFSLITKKQMNFGNYCMIDDLVYRRACNASFVHLAAYLSKQNVEKAELKYDRMRRIDGKSKMSLNSLIHHAFRSLIEYSESLLMVFFKFFLVTILAIGFLFVVVLYKKFIIHDAIIGWASSISMSLVNSALISFGFFVIGILVLNVLSKNNLANRELFIDAQKDISEKPNL